MTVKGCANGAQIFNYFCRQCERANIHFYISYFFLDKANNVEVFNCCHLEHCTSRYIFSQYEVRYYTGICFCTTFTAITIFNTATTNFTTIITASNSFACANINIYFHRCIKYPRVRVFSDAYFLV